MRYQDNFSLKRLQDRAEIQHVMNVWCRAIDRCDWGLVREVFHEDGYDDHGSFKGNVEELIAWLEERHKTIFRCMHYITNLLIEFADAHNALVESYSFSMQQYTVKDTGSQQTIWDGSEVSHPFDLLGFGRYIDQFQRRDGRWKIYRRTCVIDNAITLPLPASGPPRISPDWEVAQRNGNDLIWRIRSQLGLGRDFSG